MEKIDMIKIEIDMIDDMGLGKMVPLKTSVFNGKDYKIRGINKDSKCPEVYNRHNERYHNNIIKGNRTAP